jgi:hypothetical protein
MPLARMNKEIISIENITKINEKKETKECFLKNKKYFLIFLRYLFPTFQAISTLCLVFVVQGYFKFY